MTKRFSPAWATRVLLLGALGMLLGLAARLGTAPGPAAAAAIQAPQAKTQPSKVIRIVRVVRQPIAVSRGS